MKANKIKANIKLNESVYPFFVNPEEESYYREAAELLNSKINKLKGQYSVLSSSPKVLGVVALEAMVDALKLNERYLDLQNSINARLDELTNRFN